MAENTTYAHLLDPLKLATIGNLELVAKLVVEGFLVGLHKSPYHGFSVEFAEYRQYNPGDSLRSIDWKVFARTEKYFVKEFEEETNLRSYILLDKSASMAFSHAGRISKLDYGVLLSAALSFLMVRQKDAVGLLTFDAAPDELIPASMTKTGLAEVLRRLSNVRPSGKTHVNTTFLGLSERITRRGLIILISDLLDDMDDVIAALKHFRHMKHEVIVFHLLDPMELTFDFTAESEFTDLETGQKLPVQPWMIRTDYQRAAATYFDTLKYRCTELGVDYNLVTTNTPFELSLLAYLHKRTMLR